MRRYGFLAGVAVMLAVVASADVAPRRGTLERAILGLANTADQATLERAIRMGWVGTNFTDFLVAREAEGVIAHRAGWDRMERTADDNRFDSLEELYATTSMGPESMEGMERYAALYLRTPAGSPTLRYVNKRTTSANVLVRRVHVDAQTAVNIANTRRAGVDHQLGTADDAWMPYGLIFGETALRDAQGQHVHSLDEVPGVSAPTIQRISDYAMLHRQ